MFKDSVFRNENINGVYFKFINDTKGFNGTSSDWNLRTLDKKIEIKVLEVGNSRIDGRPMLLFNKKFNENITPIENDLIYLNKKLYKIGNTTSFDENIIRIHLIPYNKK